MNQAARRIRRIWDFSHTEPVDQPAGRPADIHGITRAQAPSGETVGVILKLVTHAPTYSVLRFQTGFGP